jgi:succinate dehydrogenase / fumarate reductase, cytochrome b subunit
MSKGSFFSASIGRKFLMSITGLFLVMFLLVHMSINLLLIFDDNGDLYNVAAHFMATNPFIKIMEPVLALGFIVHIAWSIIITVQNMKARPVRYNRTEQAINSTWASRNMLILGGMLFVFMGMHLFHFWWKMKFVGDPLLAEVAVNGVMMHNSYALVKGLFVSHWAYCLLYILGGWLLGLHISHGFWSAFQTIGLNNQIWRKRLFIVAKVIGWIFTVGFGIIPIYFMIKF